MGTRPGNWDLGLGRFAFIPEYSRGRRGDIRHADDDSDSPFDYDIGAILACKAFRRLSHKTQVFPGQLNVHARTRAFHTYEVAATARRMAMRLGLNRELAFAIALGHDIGHAPFGHITEVVIGELTGKPFSHSTFGVVIAQHIERRGKGLSLARETLSGIECHDRNPIRYPENTPQEYTLVYYADKISWVFADVNDIIFRMRIGDTQKLRSLAARFGQNQRERVRLCCNELVWESERDGDVSFVKSEVAKDFATLKRWLYTDIYDQLDWRYHCDTIKYAYDFLSSYRPLERCDPTILLALMTDGEVIRLSQWLLTHLNRQKCDIVGDFGIWEIARYIRDRDINIFDPDLDW